MTCVCCWRTSQLMAQSLEDARNEATVLSYSWDLALESYNEEDLGTLLFDTLFELAPTLKAVYRKPRPVRASACPAFMLHELPILSHVTVSVSPIIALTIGR